MQELEITRPTGQSILINLFPSSESNQAIVFVGGSSDTRNTFNALVLKLQNQINRPIITFSFSGIEDGNQPTLYQQSLDLKLFLQFIKRELRFSLLTLICTSMGAYSTVEALLDKQFDTNITKVIFVDPADYYIAEAQNLDPKTWSGFETYNPDKETSSKQLTRVSSSVKIDVIHFLLRNHGPNGYSPTSGRGSDNPKYFPRLSTSMVKSFFYSIPEKNKGLYIENKLIPHAFMRDGDIEKNVLELAEVIRTCII